MLVDNLGIKKNTVELYSYDLNKCLVKTGQSMAIFLLTDGTDMYLLRGTTVSPYMSQRLYEDIREAINLKWSIDEIASLYDVDATIRILKVSMDFYKKYCTNPFDWNGLDYTTLK